MIVAWPTRTPATSVIAFAGPGRPRPMTIPRSRARTNCVLRTAPTRRDPRPIIAPVIRTTSGRLARAPPAPRAHPAPRVRLERLPELAGVARDRRRRSVPRPAGPRRCSRAPGPGRERALDVPDGRSGRAPRCAGRRRRSVRRRPDAAGAARRRGVGVGRRRRRRRCRRSSAGSPGTWPTTSGHALERLPTLSADDQGLPLLRLALHDWVIAWDRRTGAAWLGGRALDGDVGRLDRRLAEVRERVRRPRHASSPRRRRGRPALTFRSSLDRRGVRGGRRGDPSRHRPRRHLPGEPHPPPRDAVRAAIRGRSTAGCGPAIRRCSPPISTSVGAGGRPRAILSASPEPFLSVDRTGRVKTDPIKGTRPARPDARGGSGARLRAARERQGPGGERDDRGRAAERPRAGLPAGERPGAAPVPARADGRGPASRLDRHRAARAGSRRLRPARGRRSRAARSPAPRRSGRWSSSRRSSRSAAGPVHRRARLDRAGRRDGDDRSSSGRSSRTARG